MINNMLDITSIFKSRKMKGFYIMKTIREGFKCFFAQLRDMGIKLLACMIFALIFSALALFADKGLLVIIASIILSLFSFEFMPFLFEKYEVAIKMKVSPKGKQWEVIIRFTGIILLLMCFFYAILNQCFNLSFQRFFEFSSNYECMINLLASTVIMSISFLLSMIVFALVSSFFLSKRTKWYEQSDEKQTE